MIGSVIITLAPTLLTHSKCKQYSWVALLRGSLLVDLSIYSYYKQRIYLLRQQIVSLVYY